MRNSNTVKQSDAYDLRRFRLLILEDSAFIGNLLSGALKKMGVGTVMTVQNVSAAKDMILKYNGDDDQVDIDVIMTDWLLPDGMGMDLISWLRDHPRDNIKYMPVIVCSAYANTDLVEQSRDCGATEVMVKPVSAEKIAHRILYVIDKPRPFIQTSDFFGPDRRRKEIKFTDGERRTMRPEDVEIENEYGS